MWFQSFSRQTILPISQSIGPIYLLKEFSRFFQRQLHAFALDFFPASSSCFAVYWKESCWLCCFWRWWCRVSSSSDVMYPPLCDSCCTAAFVIIIIYFRLFPIIYFFFRFVAFWYSSFYYCCSSSRLGLSRFRSRWYCLLHSAFTMCILLLVLRLLLHLLLSIRFSPVCVLL